MKFQSMIKHVNMHVFGHITSFWQKFEDFGGGISYDWQIFNSYLHVKNIRKLFHCSNRSTLVSHALKMFIMALNWSSFEVQSNSCFFFFFCIEQQVLLGL